MIPLGVSISPDAIAASWLSIRFSMLSPKWSVSSWATTQVLGK